MPRVLIALVLSLALCLVWAGPAAAQQAGPVASPTGGPLDTLIDVGGRSLHVACAGEDTGAPPVLYEIGGPDPEGATSAVTDAGDFLSDAMGTRFCAYDRAGTGGPGGSDPDPAGVRTFTEAAADLAAVLASPELGCPCVVIGESLGGSITLVALASDPEGFVEHVAGLVLLDPPYPGYWDTLVGLAPAGSPEAALDADPYLTGGNKEALDMPAGFRQVAVPDEPPGIPVLVVAHGVGEPPGCFPCSDAYPTSELEEAWQAGQAELAEALGGRLVVAEGISHYIAEEDAELVIGLTVEVIAAVSAPADGATPHAAPAG